MDGADRRRQERRGPHARQDQDRGADGGDPLPPLQRHALRRDRHRRLGPVADLDLRRAHRLVDGLLPAEGHPRDPGTGEMTGAARSAGWLRVMPAVFVLIWSTGFIVARYGMPYAPPLKFLSVRYALSVVCFLVWV